MASIRKIKNTRTLNELQMPALSLSRADLSILNLSFQRMIFEISAQFWLHISWPWMQSLACPRISNLIPIR